MKTLITLFTISILLVGTPLKAQSQKDKLIFPENKKGYYQYVLEEIEKFNKVEKIEKKSMKMDFSKYDLPKNISEFKYYWHQKPTNQGQTGTCWSFCMTSFLESEIYRLRKEELRLSEMWTAYWEFVEKAKGFVQTRGKSFFGEGSQSNAIKRIYNKYGIVPREAYTGLLPNQKVYDHGTMFKEMTAYLNSIKQNNNWDEKQVESTIISILNQYMGEPPTSVRVNGKDYTPKEYYEKIVKINLEDYVDFMSLMEVPYFERGEYPVPDNWWHNKDYHNIPLDVFMDIIKKSIRGGYTICIGGDVSEPGLDGWSEVAMIPAFDIPSEYIDENARQFRFSNKTTEDDHGIHLVGYVEKDGKDWYLIKDSGSGAQNGPNKGYYFYHEDFVKLKMLSFAVHKDMVKDILQKFNK